MRYTECDKENLKPHITDYLQAQGIDTRKPFRCLNPNHEDKNPSMSLDWRTNRVKCFSMACGATYDLYDLLQMDGSAGSLPEAVAEAARRYGYTLSEDTGAALDWNDTVTDNRKPAEQPEDAKVKKTLDAARAAGLTDAAVGYLESRGISRDTAAAMGVCSLPTFWASSGNRWSDALVFPTGTDSFTAGNINRGEDKKSRYVKRGRAGIFNADALSGNDDVIHVCEGELDAMSVAEVGGAACAIGSAANYELFTRELSRRTAQSGHFDKTLIITLDNDESGQSASNALLTELYSLQAKTESFKNMKVLQYNVSGDYNDPNEALTNDRAAFVERVTVKTKEDAKKLEYNQGTAKNRIHSFIDWIQSEENTRPISTGFRWLDKYLDGGLYEGFYAIPAISSLGKTTLALQMAENIAMNGTDVLFFSLEMGEHELIARGISRQTLLQVMQDGKELKNAKTVHGITCRAWYKKYSDYEKDLIKKAFRNYETISGHMYFIEGLTATDSGLKPEQVEERVKKHIDFTGRKPVVFVDYLQILRPSDPKQSDKVNMDIAALKMKRISKNHRIPVIAVCSVNRANYNERINLAAIKESGGIEYTTDVVIGLQLEGAGDKHEGDPKKWVDDKMKGQTRQIEAVLLKNRNGVRSKSVYFDYYPAYNYFMERGEDTAGKNNRENRKCDF